MNIDNLVIELRRKVALLENTQTVFVDSEPRSPKTSTIWIDSGTSKFWDGANWVIGGGIMTNWNTTVVFTASTYRVIDWTTGVVSVGTTDSKVDYATTSGNFTMTTTTYFYWQADNPTAIQTTTTAGAVVAAGGILLAVGRLNPDTVNVASLKVFGGPSVDLIIADGIVANSITTNMLQANSITAAKLAVTLLYAGAITLDTNGLIKGGQTAYDTGTGFFLGYSTSTYKLSIGNSAGNKLTWDGTTLSITGTLTATAGTIGGFSIGSDYMRDAANSFGLSSTVTGGDDVRFWAGDTFANRATAPFRITEAGAVTGSSFTLTGGSMAGVSIASIPNSTATDISLMEKSHNLTFSVTNATTIAWTSGTIIFSHGRTFSISSGNTGVMAALTYIYLDPGVSTTVLQTTTTYSTAMGANKSLIGMAQNNTVTAMFIPYGAGTPLIDGSNIGAASILAGNIAASTITATNISTLNMTGKSCTFDTGTIGGWTMASTTLTASSGGNTTILSSGSTAFSAGPTGSPTVIITQAGVLTATGAVINGYNVASKGTFGGNGADGVVADANLTITGSDYTIITKNYSSWTAGSAARSFTVTPIGCILYIKVNGNVDLTNWTFDFNGKGTAGGTGSGVTGIMGQTGGGASGADGAEGASGASSINDGVAGGAGATGGVSLDFVSTNLPLTKQYMLDCGTGGGSGGATGQRAGGNGGGCVIMEVTGNVALGSCTFNFEGDDGIITSGGISGGGGGGGGTLLILYNGTLSGSSTNNVAGGEGGSHTGSGIGGTGTVITQINTAF